MSLWLFPEEESMDWSDEETRKLPIPVCCCGGEKSKEPHYEWCDVYEKEEECD